MISFSSFPISNDYGGINGPHRLYDISDEAEMEIDDDYFETSGSKLTCPGQSLTSSQAYMR